MGIFLISGISRNHNTSIRSLNNISKIYSIIAACMKSEDGMLLISI